MAVGIAVHSIAVYLLVTGRFFKTRATIAVMVAAVIELSQSLLPLQKLLEFFQRKHNSEQIRLWLSAVVKAVVAGGPEPQRLLGVREKK